MAVVVAYETRNLCTAENPLRYGRPPDMTLRKQLSVQKLSDAKSLALVGLTQSRLPDPAQNPEIRSVTIRSRANLLFCDLGTAFAGPALFHQCLD